MASHAHQPASPRARTTPKPPRAREDSLSRTPTSKSPGSHHLQTPASPLIMPATPISDHLPGLAPSMNPREPAHHARNAHLRPPPRARTPMPHPASPLTMPVTPISGHTPGLIPSDTPYLSQRNTEATQENRQKTTKNRKTTPDRRSSIRPTN